MCYEGAQKDKNWDNFYLNTSQEFEHKWCNIGIKNKSIKVYENISNMKCTKGIISEYWNHREFFLLLAYLWTILFVFGFLPFPYEVLGVELSLSCYTLTSGIYRLASFVCFRKFFKFSLVSTNNFIAEKNTFLSFTNRDDICCIGLPYRRILCIHPSHNNEIT